MILINRRNRVEEMVILLGIEDLEGNTWSVARSRITCLKVTIDDKCFVYVDGHEIEVDKETLDKIENLL